MPMVPHRADLTVCWFILTIALLVVGGAMSRPVLVAAEPVTAGIRVLPWNGHASAISATFDDGDASHLDTAIPELDQRGLKGTFFMVGNSADQRIDEWRRAYANGHELGNHSMNHLQPGGFTAAQLVTEVDQAQALLEGRFGTTIVSYCYPFCAVTPELKQQVGAYVAARVGGNQIVPLVGATDRDPDWLNLPSFGAETKTTMEVYRSWIDQAKDQHGWCVLMIHAIEGSPWGWQPLPKTTFQALLDELVTRQPTTWVAPFGEVAAYYRAQRAVGSARVTMEGSVAVLSWTLSAAIPRSTVLKAVLDPAMDPRAVLSQGGTALVPDAKGIFTIAAAAGELRIARP